MKKLSNLVLLLAAVLVLASCTGEAPVRDVTLEVPRNVTGPYLIDGKPVAGLPGTDRAVLPVFKVKVSEGQHSLSYYLDGEKKLSILTVEGDDVRFEIPDGKLDIPKEVWSSVELTKEGAHVALMVFMEDGTGSRIEFNAAFDTTDLKLPEFEYTPVAWKEEGGKIVYSFGEKPDVGRILQDGLDVAGMKWVEHTGAENASKELTGSWMLFAAEPIGQLPSIVKGNLVIEKSGNMHLLAEVDLEGLPAFDVEELPGLQGLKSGIRIQGGVDIPKIKADAFEAKFSENGSIVLLKVKSDNPLFKYVRIPLLRAPEDISRVTEPVEDRVIGNLSDFVKTVGAIKPVADNTLTLSDLFIKLGAYPVSDGRVTLLDVSGKWNDGTDDWYSYYGTSWKGTKPDGRMIFSVPSMERSEWVEFDAASVTRHNDAIKSHEIGADKTLSKVTVGNNTYTRTAAPDMEEVLDALMLNLTGTKLSEIVLEIRNGQIGIYAGKFIPVMNILSNGTDIAFELKITKAAIGKFLPEVAKPVLQYLPDEGFASLIIPVTRDGLEICTLKNGSIVIPLLESRP